MLLSRLLLGLTPLTTGQVGGRCSAEALSSHFSTAGPTGTCQGSSRLKLLTTQDQHRSLVCCVVVRNYCADRKSSLLTKQSIKNVAL